MDKQPAIFNLADAGDTVGAFALLDGGNVAIDARDGDGRTALHHAAAAGHAQLLHALIARGGKFETQDGGSWSPLHSAASAGRDECVQELIAAGAGLELGAGGSGSTALVLAASKGHAGVVRALVSASANALAVDGSGGTALHRSAAKGHLAVMEILIASHPKLIDLRDRAGNSAFHLAAIHEQAAACIALAEAGAELTTTNAEGESPSSLLKPSLRSQLGLLGEAEEAEDHTDWLSAHYPVPQPNANASGRAGLYL